MTTDAPPLAQMQDPTKQYPQPPFRPVGPDEAGPHAGYA